MKVNHNNKIITNDEDSTSISGIYAIGNVCEKRSYLPTSTILAGKLLAKRLFGEGKIKMNYQNVPMTIFTPI